MSVTINGTSGLVFNDASTQNTAATGFGFKNRLINSAMMIDQRNAGASVTPSATAAFQFTVDRWAYNQSAASKFSFQQNAGSVTPPVGFTNYLGFTSQSAYSVTSSDYFYAVQRIEGFNTADLAWGTANASPVTIGFWVRSSLTGTFGGTLTNNAGNRYYIFSYTISAANTWEYKTVTIAGDTTGTWATNNSTGIELRFGLGSGSTFTGTAGSWSGTTYLQPTGSVNVVGTNGATFYITGVQLEKGSTATSFDYRPYGTEFSLCERYCQTIVSPSVGFMVLPAVGGIASSGTARLIFSFSEMRSPPTTTFASAGNFLVQEATGSNNRNVTAVSTISTPGVNSMGVDFSITGGVSGQPAWVYSNNVAGLLVTMSAEL